MNEKIFETIIIFFSVMLPGSIITLLIHKMINNTLRKLDDYKNEVHSSILKELEHIRDKLELRFTYIEKRLDSLEENEFPLYNESKNLKITPKICLIVDDNQYQRAFLKDAIKLNYDNILIYEATSYDEAIKLINTIYFNIAIIDYDLKSDKTGIDILDYCKKNNRLVLKENGCITLKTILYTTNIDKSLTLPIGIESCILDKTGNGFSVKLLVRKINYILDNNQ
jgi:CheY-like chemotaxis protein